MVLRTSLAASLPGIKLIVTVFINFMYYININWAHKMVVFYLFNKDKISLNQRYILSGMNIIMCVVATEKHGFVIVDMTLASIFRYC